MSSGVITEDGEFTSGEASMMSSCGWCGRAGHERFTSKCMSAMIELVKTRALDDMQDLVFLHTGGAAAIHPYAHQLS